VIKDTIIQEIPGEPLIPYYQARILLPHNIVVRDITVKHSTPVIQHRVEIPWGQPPCTISNPGSVEPVGRNEAVYNSSEGYPCTVYDVVSVQSFRGFKIVTVVVIPCAVQTKA